LQLIYFSLSRMASLVGRPLHYVIKIGDRKKSYEFYVGTLGMKILRHEEFGEGCEAECNGPYNGKWSKTMVGYGEEDNHFVVEMTYNYEIGAYTKGDDLHGLYVDNKEVFDQLASNGASCWDEDNRLRLRDPDGHSIFVGGETPIGKPSISRVALNVNDIEKSIAFWSGLLNMKVESKEERRAVLSYQKKGRPWVLQLNSMGKTVNRATAYGRTAFACTTDKLAPLEAAVKSGGGTILKPLVSLGTPGKATVHVVILADPDGHEICFVGEEAFKELSKIDPKSDGEIQKAIKDDWSGEWFKNGKKTM
ncbi:glod-4, partial [Pristionchus pacificus]